jgi:6-phosphofructokinase 1
MKGAAMQHVLEDFQITRLGECRVQSPMSGHQFIEEDERILVHSDPREIRLIMERGEELPSFQIAGPRQRIYFDPSKLKCGIVTCGGLCPGLNDVIRSIVLCLFHHYDVQMVFGFRYGYEGLSSRHRHAPLELTPTIVNRIHESGGSLLGSSRGQQDLADMVDTLERMNVGALFTIGGDGTLRGAHALAEEIKNRGLKIAVVGIPKTIDNDISYVQTSFGFQTAISQARRATYAAHSEAEGYRNGIGLVKLMGRESGFIPAYVSLADNQVNFCLIPEVPFKLDRFLESLRERLERRAHAVIVVGEGVGQELFEESLGRDASGNVRFGDIGLLLRDRIKEHFASIGMEISLKYIDPGYIIRSVPANAFDSAFCLMLGQSAVHAAMAGCTDMVVGYWKNIFTHVPTRLATWQRKRIDPEGWLWSSVLASTGQSREI